MSEAPMEIGGARRRRLANRRPAVTETIAFTRADGNRAGYEASVGFDELGRAREIFLAGAKDGTDMAAALNDAAIVLSVALQHGVPTAALAHSVARAPGGEGEAMACSPIGAALALLMRYERERDSIVRSNREELASECEPDRDTRL